MTCEHDKEWDCIDCARQEIAALEARCAELTDSNWSLNNSLNCRNEEFRAANNKIAALEAENKRLTKEADEYKLGWEKAGDAYRSLRDSINTLMEGFK